jgi:hypothetical protein
VLPKDPAVPLMELHWSQIGWEHRGARDRRRVE